MFETKIIAMIVVAVITIGAAILYVALKVDAADEKERALISEDMRYRQERAADIAAARAQAARPGRMDKSLAKIGN